jgi:hypothetical protein
VPTLKDQAFDQQAIWKGTIMTTKNTTTAAAGIEAARRLTQARSSDLELVNGYELRAIEDLSAWVAAEQDAAPETVRSITEASFGVHDVGAIPRKSYDEVVRFLLDLRLDDIPN